MRFVDTKYYRKHKGPTVMGLDLSLRSTGAVVLRRDWTPGPGMFEVPVLRCGSELSSPTQEELVRRLASIVASVALLADECGVTHAFVEDHAYGLSGQNGIRLAELSGAIKVGLYERLGLVVVPVNQSTVRKFFLGKLPAKDRAQVTHAKLRELGCEWEASDLGDALLVASYGRSEIGLPGLTLAV